MAIELEVIKLHQLQDPAELRVAAHGKQIVLAEVATTDLDLQKASGGLRVVAAHVDLARRMARAHGSGVVEVAEDRPIAVEEGTEEHLQLAGRKIPVEGNTRAAHEDHRPLGHNQGVMDQE